MSTLSHHDDDFEELEDAAIVPSRNDDHLGAVDPTEDIDFTPEASSDDACIADLPIGEPDIDDDEPLEKPAPLMAGGPGALPDVGGGKREIDEDASDVDVSESEATDSERIEQGLSFDDDDDDGLDGDEADDGGNEGTSEDISLLVESEALPELDADEDGAFEVADLMNELGQSGFGREGTRSVWASHEAWAVELPIADVVARQGAVIAVGAQLMTMDSNESAWKAKALPTSANAVDAGENAIVVGALETLLLVSVGAESGPLSLFRSERAIRSIAIASGRTWFIAGDELWVVGSPPATPKRIRSRGALDVAAQGARIVLLSEAEHRLTVERFRGDDGDWETLELPSEFGTGARASLELVVQRNKPAIAIASRNALTIAWDGDDFLGIEVDDALGFGFGKLDDDDALFAVMRVGSELQLMAASTDRKSFEFVMTLPTRFARARSFELAWCDAREALFIAGDEGMIAVRPQPTH